MTILAIGAHPDDVELGCGATLARASREGVRVVALVLTDGGRGPSGYGSRRLEQEQAAAVLGVELRWGGLEDGDLRQEPHLVDLIGEAIEDTSAAVVLTHAEADSHQDHVAACRAAVAASRTLTQVLHYETPSTLRFSPTVFNDVSESAPAKLEALRCHLSQVVGAARVDMEAIEAQLRFRGFQGRLRVAEAFEATRSLMYPVAGGGASTLELRSSRTLEA